MRLRLRAGLRALLRNCRGFGRRDDAAIQPGLCRAIARTRRTSIGIRIQPLNDPNAPVVLTIINLLPTEIDLGISSDNTATRRQLTLQGSLVVTKNGQKIADRALVARAPYNVLISQYATIVARENAERQAVNDLARQIETQIAVLLKDMP